MEPQLIEVLEREEMDEMMPKTRIIRAANSMGALGKKGEGKSKIVNRTFIRIPQSKLMHTWK